jgi:type I restriction enzyme S subunit
MKIWPTKKLGEVCSLDRGTNPIHSSLFSKIKKVGYIRFVQLRDFETDEYVVYIPKNLRITISNKDDSIIALSGATAGKVVMGLGGAINSALLRVRPSNTDILDKGFLHYFLLLSQKLLSRLGRGGAQPNISKGDIAKIKIPVPPLSIQRKIVEKLDAIKKAQELNDKQIALADELFQSLLHKELDPKGKNWEIKKLGDVVEFLDHQRIPLNEGERAKKKGPYPYYGATGVLDWIDDYIFNGEYVLLAEDGGPFFQKDKPVAYRVSGKCWVNNHVHVLTAKNLINIDFLGYTLMFMDLTVYLTGSTRAKLNKSRAEKIKIPLPPLETQKKIIEKLFTVQEYKKKLLKQKQLLHELFDSVLNKFFEGNLNI